MTNTFNNGVDIKSGNFYIGPETTNSVTNTANQLGYGSSSTVITSKATTAGGYGVLELIGQAGNNTMQSGHVNFVSFNAQTAMCRIAALRHNADEHGSLLFQTAGSSALGNAMVIDYEKNVGIGIDSPLSRLHIKHATDISMDANAAGHMRIEGSGYTGAIALNSDAMFLYHNSAGRGLAFGTNETEAFRVTTSNTVHFKVDNDVNLNGVSGAVIIGGDGTGQHIAFDSNEIQSKSDSTTPANLHFNADGGSVYCGNNANLTRFKVRGVNGGNEITSQEGANILSLTNEASSGTVGGYIGYRNSAGTRLSYVGHPANNHLYMNNETSGGHLYFICEGSYHYTHTAGSYRTRLGSVEFRPYYNYNDSRGLKLGNSNALWKEVWSNDTSINSSDITLKKDIINTPLGLNFIKLLRPVQFKWKDGGVRDHQGLIAQEVKTILDSLPETSASNQAMWVDSAVTGVEETRHVSGPDENGNYVDETVPAPTEQFMRYTELIGPIIKALQEIDNRLTSVENRR